MTTELPRQEILNAITAVEHPEIAASLMDLGMLRDIQLIEAETAVGLTLVLPTLGIPEQVRAYLLNSLYHAIQPFGLKLKVMLDEMDDAGKQHFFAQAQAAWKADGDCAACGSPN
jgi:hypothetical protein